MNATSIIKKLAPDFTPRLGIILGSGLRAIADAIEVICHIPYSDLPGFWQSSVEGHHGTLTLGHLHGVPIACLQGRAHIYEGAEPNAIKIMVRTLKLIGCDTLLVTNAAGSLNENSQPGSLMLIADHINCQFNNPLIGPNDDTFGPRFVDMTTTYDASLRKELRAHAKALNITLHEGIYVGVTGPVFETPAEIRAFKQLGADAVGMSTVPEVIVARHCDLRVLCISVITNLAAGLSDKPLSHEETLAVGKQASGALSQLLERWLSNQSL